MLLPRSWITFFPKLARRIRGRSRNPPLRLAHSLISNLTEDSNDQSTCPLFCIIPPELRHHIFVLTLTSCDDETRPYPPTAYYTRQGYRYYQKIHTALLVTCRRIYSETHDLPVSLNEHVFWCSRGPEALNYKPHKYFLRLTPEQRNAVKHVHFFTQLYWLRYDFAQICTLQEMRPKHLKITIRHSDWWFWERNERLRMEDPTRWARNLSMVERLEGLEIKMETMERDEDQLEGIVQTMLKWEFKLFDGRVLTTNGMEIIRDRWIGQSSFDGEYRYNAHSDRWDMIWGLPTDEYGPEPGLAYCVVTLRWQPDVQLHLQDFSVP